MSELMSKEGISVLEIEQVFEGIKHGEKELENGFLTLSEAVLPGSQQGYLRTCSVVALLESGCSVWDFLVPCVPFISARLPSGLSSVFGEPKIFIPS